jgi:Zn-finger in ubiquitin-hydrolases and other protein
MKSERDGINPAVEPSGTGCVECLALGGWWFHLRRCAECGHIGCCDSSPNQHASKHKAATGHPIITSFEPGERWFYDYRTEQFFAGPKLLTLLTRIRWINQCPDRPEQCLQTGKRCFTNRERLFWFDREPRDQISVSQGSRLRIRSVGDATTARPKSERQG